MSGEMFFHKGGIHVDAARVIIQNNTYSIRSITSITTDVETTSSAGDGCVIICLAVGFFFIAFLVAVLVINNQALGFITLGIIFFVSILILGHGIKLMFAKKVTTYYIYLRMASGESIKLPPAQNYEEHQDILHALNKAIAATS